MNYWLMKSEPTDYSIDDLEKDKEEPWDGVRNYQARNFMRDKMRIGDLVLLYHSNTKPPGIAGIAKVSSKPIPDHTAWNPKNKHYDPKSSKEKPIWMMVKVKFVEKFPEIIPLNDLREEPSLQEMRLLQKGNRLSITPVTKKEYQAILKMA